MPLITQEEAEQAVRPFAEQCVAVIRSAFDDWLQGPYTHQMQRKSLRANIISNQMLANARRVFDNVAGVRVDDVPGYTGLLVGDNIFIRMKKADENLMSRNYPTKSALSYVDQSKDMFGGLVRLELVYQLGAYGTKIERIALLQRHKSKIVWHIDLLDSGAAIQEVLPFAQPPAPEGSAAQRVLKPKRKSKKEEKDVSTG
jgi:hypothetical protein